MDSLKNKARLTPVLFIVCLLLFNSCDPGPKGYNYEIGSLPVYPVNLEDFNTEYDDYNATAPSLGRLIPFCFSTNRKTQGNEFDVLYQPMNVNFDKTTGVLKVTNMYSNWSVFSDKYEVIKNAVDKINTSGNELGPFLIEEQDFNAYYFTLLGASDVSGDYQINFTSNISNPDFSETKPVVFLNSEFDDLYPCLPPYTGIIYFCSNREENKFDIYFAEIDKPENDLELILSDTSFHSIVKDTLISSNANDKCPFVFYDVMVFASDRSGGYGGFDLYFCTKEGGSWSAPENFGENINSEWDEYRPILISEGVSQTQTMMVFSSNREGGKGGFDLYFVGVALNEPIPIE